MKYTVFASELEGIVKKINRIANKCKKAGIPFVLSIGETYERTIRNRESAYNFRFVDLEVNCEFRINGWNVLGTVQRKDGIVQCYFNDQELIREYQDTDFHCDHCKKKARRLSVVVLEHENGERKLVGTSCVKEFTCGLSGELVASVADLSWELENDSSQIMDILRRGNCPDCDLDDEWNEAMNDMLGRGYCVRSHDVEKVVACASYLIREYGFKPSDHIDATWKYIPSVLDVYRKAVTDFDKEQAKAAIQWVCGLSEDERTKSSYIFNLYQICAAEYCTSRHFGLLASLIPAHKKAVVRAIVDDEKQKSQHFGEVGAKVSADVVITKIAGYKTMWGNCWIISMKDKSGNAIVWKTSSLGSLHKLNLSDGSGAKVTGTIKEHSEYRGEKQTVLTRCKFERIEAEHECASNGVDKAMNQLMEQWG